MPSQPAVVNLPASVPPLLPTWKMMASEVPAPEVDLRVSVEPAAIPPMRRGVVTEVPMVGVALKDGAPPLATSMVFVPP